jgi:hypothetical protein
MTDEEMLREFPRRARAKDWFIRVMEFAPGGYAVAAQDRWGRQVNQTCAEGELQRVIEEVERYAENVAGERTEGR